MNKKAIICTFIIGSLWFTNCERKHSASLTEKEKQFARVYAAMVQLQRKYPKNTKAYIDSSQTILQKYNIDIKTYHQITQELNEKPERWEAFYKEVLEMLNDQSNE